MAHTPPWAANIIGTACLSLRVFPREGRVLSLSSEHALHFRPLPLRRYQVVPPQMPQGRNTVRRTWTTNTCTRRRKRLATPPLAVMSRTKPSRSRSPSATLERARGSRDVYVRARFIDSRYGRKRLSALPLTVVRRAPPSRAEWPNAPIKGALILRHPPPPSSAPGTAATVRRRRPARLR